MENNQFNILFIEQLSKEKIRPKGNKFNLK